MPARAAASASSARARSLRRTLGDRCAPRHDTRTRSLGVFLVAPLQALEEDLMIRTITAAVAAAITLAFPAPAAAQSALGTPTADRSWAISASGGVVFGGTMTIADI